MKIEKREVKMERRGRPKKQSETVEFNSAMNSRHLSVSLRILKERM